MHEKNGFIKSTKTPNATFYQITKKELMHIPSGSKTFWILLVLLEVEIITNLSYLQRNYKNSKNILDSSITVNTDFASDRIAEFF
jgi:hypothetical protein